MPRAALALLLCLCLPDALAQPLIERSRRDDIVFADDEEPAMKQAFARARAGLDAFLQDALARAPRHTMHGFKVRISNNKHTEYFWVMNVRRFGTGFRGRIDNQPRLVKHLREGQLIGFRRSDIVDWLYVDRDGRMQGNYTLCALLTKEDPEQAQALLAHLRLRCD